MRQVTIHEAKTNLSKLIREALNGEEVVIAKGRKPLVRLEVLPGVKPERRIGGAKGLVREITVDFDAPMDDFAEYM